MARQTRWAKDMYIIANQFSNSSVNSIKESFIIETFIERNDMIKIKIIRWAQR